MQDNNHKPQEISIEDLISLILAKKYSIVISSLILIFLSTVYLFITPNTYQSSATLMINGSQQSLSDSLSQYSSLASFAGISIPSDSSQNRADLAIETIRSKKFFDHILRKHNLLPDIFAAKAYDLESKKIIYDSKLYDAKSKKWVRKPNFLNNVVPSTLEAYQQYMKSLSVYEDSKTGFIKISFNHVSPQFSNRMINIIISELNFTTRAMETDRAKKSLSYLQNELKNTQESSIKSSIAALIQKELTTLMTANIDEDYILQYIDQPFIPEKHIAPNRGTFLIISALISLILSITIVFLRDVFFSKEFLK